MTPTRKYAWSRFEAFFTIAPSLICSPASEKSLFAAKWQLIEDSAPKSIQENSTFY